MRLLLTEGHFSAVREALSESLPHAAYFASATESAPVHAGIRRWMTAMAKLNLGFVNRILKAIYSSTRDGDIKHDASSLIELIQTFDTLSPDDLQDTLLDCSLLSWLASANRATAMAASPMEFLDVVRSLPLLVPGVVAKATPIEYRVTLHNAVWPVGLSWGWSSSAGTARVAVGQDRNISLRIGSESILLKNVAQRSVALRIFQRRTVAGTSLDVTVPREPYHRVWAHKFSALPDAPPAEPITASVQRSFELLHTVWPEANQLKLYAQRLVAYVPRSGDQHHSASTPEFPFVQYANVVLNSEQENLYSYLHEAMHSKLAILMSARHLHRHGEVQEFQHPWMDGVRPADGVFFGAHAFLNIFELASRIRERLPSRRTDAETTLDRHETQLTRAMQEFGRMRLTPAGKELVDKMQSRFEQIRRSH